MKRWSISLIIWKMQIKPQWDTIVDSLHWLKLKTHYCKYIDVRSNKIYNHFTRNCRTISKVKPYDPTTPIYLKEGQCIPNQRPAHEYHSNFIHKAWIWKQLKYLLKDQQINYGELIQWIYSTAARIKILTHTTGNLKNKMLSKRSQTQNVLYKSFKKFSKDKSNLQWWETNKQLPRQDRQEEKHLGRSMRKPLSPTWMFCILTVLVAAHVGRNVKLRKLLYLNLCDCISTELLKKHNLVTFYFLQQLTLVHRNSMPASMAHIMLFTWTQSLPWRVE